jgi:hypothetical protein
MTSHTDTVYASSGLPSFGRQVIEPRFDSIYLSQLEWGHWRAGRESLKVEPRNGEFVLLNPPASFTHIFW